MTLKIYGRRSSANVQKVVWLCCEANLKFDTEKYGSQITLLKILKSEKLFNLY